MSEVEKFIPDPTIPNLIEGAKSGDLVSAYVPDTATEVRLTTMVRGASLAIYMNPEQARKLSSQLDSAAEHVECKLDVGQADLVGCDQCGRNRPLSAGLCADCAGMVN